MARPITVTAGPLAVADDDGAGTTQKATAPQYLVLNGALTDGQTANNVAQSQSPGAAGNLTLNGTLASSVPTGVAVAYLGYNQRIYFTFAGNESARTFTITGTVMGPEGISAQVETLTGGNVTIKASQKRYYTITSIAIDAASAGAMTVGRAGLATFDKARHFLITSAGTDTGVTFAVSGTDWAGALISENITGVQASTAQSVLSYKTVVDVRTNTSVSTTVTLGTNGVADSPWVRFDDYGSISETTIAAIVSGVVNYDIETSMDDDNDIGNLYWANPAGMNWLDDVTNSALTASKSTFFAYTPLWARVKINSGTGSVVTTFRQPYQD